MSYQRYSFRIFLLATLLLFSIQGCGVEQRPPAASPPTSTPSPTSTPAPTRNPANETSTPTPEPGQRYTQSDGGFSYIPPSGWEIVIYPNLKYMVARGPLLGSFPIYISFVDEASSSSLDDYVAESLSALTQANENAKIISQEEFITNAAQRGVKAIFENKQLDIQLIQVFYFFDTGAMKFVATYSRTANIGQENDILVDQCTKTFRIEQ